MQIANPYKPGGFAADQFSSYRAWYKDKSQEQLKAKYADLLIDAENFCRYSWKDMEGFRFQAECIAHIYKARFDTSITDQEAS
jgi:hypothetical protein